MKDILLKSNELINVISELELNRTARHIFNYFLQHAQKKVKFENYQDNTFSINYSELNKSADYNPRAVEVTLLALKNLMRPVVITDTKTEFTAIVPVTYVDINKTTGDYVFSLEKRIIELLKNTDYFTKLDLKEFNPLKSKHSIVIFEFLKRYENLPKIPKITIDELRAITDTKDKYKLFADFEKRVLKVAIAEINEYTSYNVQCTYERTRTVRRPKVQAIQFSFTKKHSGIDLDVTEVTQKTAQNVTKNDELPVKNNSLQPHAHVFDPLYLEFCKKFKDLNVKDYEFALNTYELSTLHQFLNDMQKYSTLSNDKFLSYLEDRMKKCWQNYQCKINNSNSKQIEDMMSLLRPK